MRFTKATPKRQATLIAVLLLFVLCIFGRTAQTASMSTFTVINTDDSGPGSLRQAILDANANAGADTIDFDTAGVFAAPQTITLTSGQLEITGELTISGTGADRLTVTRNRAAPAFRIFKVNSPAAIISGLSISNGDNAEGAGIRNYGQLTLNNCTVDSNRGTDQSLEPEGGGIYNSGTLTINSSTISRNRAYAAAGVLNRGTLTVTNSTFFSNFASYAGALFSDQTLTINNSTISNNRASTTGGGIYTTGGTVTLLSTIVANNSALHGNDIEGTVTSGNYCLVEDSNGSSISGTNNVTGVDPMLASPSLKGGSTETIALLPGSPAIDKGNNPNGLANDQRGQPRTKNDSNVTDAAGGDSTDIGAVESNYLVVNTTAEDDDGACQPLAGGDCTLREAIIAANAASGAETILFDIPTNDPGYDAVADRYTITLTSLLPDLQSDMDIIGLGANRLIVKRDPNAPTFRIFNSSGTVAILGLTISGGSDIFGGGIQNYRWGTLSLTDCSISGNSASGSSAGGGGIVNVGTLTITGSTISGNSSNGFAGGIRNTGRLSVTGSTISGNSANRSGGGLDNIFDGTMVVTNSTITGNRAGADGRGGFGGGVLTGNSSAFYNTIVAGNFIGTGTLSNDIEGTIGTAKSTLIGDAASSGGITNGTDGNIVGNSGTGTIDINTVLNTTLADNGGPTKTHALVCDSPALDAGSNMFAASLTTDQRGVGFPRIFNATVDIGAFEAQASLVCNTAPVANGDLRSTDEDTPLSGSSVLADDTDGENDALTAILVSGPTNAQSFTLNSDGSFNYTPKANFNGTDSFTYKANDGSLDSNVATVTITVNPINDAPEASATPAAQTVQYSDAISDVTFTVTDIDSENISVNKFYKLDAGSFVAGLPNGLDVASEDVACVVFSDGERCNLVLKGKADVPAGVYTIRFTFGDESLNDSEDHILTVTKEKTATVYTGDEYTLTAGPTVTTASVRLGAQLTQEADGNAGDISLAKVSFLLFKSSNLGSTPDLIFSGVAVNSSGAALTFVNLAVDTWTVKVKIDANNPYWKASPVGMGTITVQQPTNELRTGGGGWVPDAQSINGKGNFGFNVANQKKGLKGSSIYLYRGSDGFNYLVKSTSWQSGGIAFSTEGTVISKAAFSGKCVVQKIDPETGEVVASFGNYSFTVDVRDGDLFNPRQADKYAITILGTNGLVWHRVGGPNAPINIGGGNITVKAK